jgi:hypothetical protein
VTLRHREDDVRTFAALLSLAVLGGTGPALAAWSEYPHPELGFVLEFPETPTQSMGTYHTVLIDSAPVHIFSEKDPANGAQYIASVVDLQNRGAEGASLTIEAEFNLSLMGEIRDNSISRVEPGKAAVFGRFITIECKSGRVPDQPGQTAAAHAWFTEVTGGAQCPDGSRLIVNMFFNRGRMYMLIGINPANAGGAPAALRFANSLSFYDAAGRRNAADHVD